jgi:hypothetical protein
LRLTVLGLELGYIGEKSLEGTRNR